MPGQPGPSAGCSIGWLSKRQVPWGIPTIWPGMEDLGPEWGVPHYSGLLRKIFDEPSELAGEDYGRSRAWQSWLTANTLGVSCIVWIEDREQPLLTRRRTKQGVNTNYGVPVAWFFGAESPRDVFRRLFRDIWHFTADKLGLPEPPPVPRHHRLATLSRHLMFGSWISMEHTNVAEPEGSPRDMALARARHDFDQDPAWRAWMNECAPLDVCGYLFVDDVQNVSTRILPTETGTNINLTVPPSYFLTRAIGHSEVPYRDVYKDLERMTWVEAARHFSWRAPPPLPAYDEGPLPEAITYDRLRRY